MRGITLDLDPKPNKAVLIGVLLMIEAFLIPLYAQLQSGSFPTSLQVATWAVSAVIQEVTYWLVFLKRSEGEEEEPT